MPIMKSAAQPIPGQREPAATQARQRRQQEAEGDEQREQVGGRQNEPDDLGKREETRDATSSINRSDRSPRARCDHEIKTTKNPGRKRPGSDQSAFGGPKNPRA